MSNVCHFQSRNCFHLREYLKDQELCSICQRVETPILLWELPYRISQTRLAGRYISSNACCIIAAALAESIYRNGILLPKWNGKKWINLKSNKCGNFRFKDNMKSRLCIALVNAIMDGNNLADNITVCSKLPECCPLKFGYNRHTFPCALEHLGSNFGEICYFNMKLIDSFSFLYSTLKSRIEHPFVAKCKQLFFVFMCVERAVLIVYEKESGSIGLFDSHTHGKNGSMITVSNVEYLSQFCFFIIKRFYSNTLFKHPDSLRCEISLLFFKGTLFNFEYPVDIKWHQKISKLKEYPNVFENYNQYLNEKEWRSFYERQLKRIIRIPQILRWNIYQLKYRYCTFKKGKTFLSRNYTVILMEDGKKKYFRRIEKRRRKNVSRYSSNPKSNLYVKYTDTNSIIELNSNIYISTAFLQRYKNKFLSLFKKVFCCGKNKVL